MFALLAVAIILTRNSRHVPYADEVLTAASSPDAEQLLTKWGPPEKTQWVDRGRPVKRLGWKITCRNGIVEVSYDETKDGNMVYENNSIVVHPLPVRRFSFLDWIRR